RVAAPEWLATSYVLQRFARNKQRAAAQFDAFVNAARSEPRRAGLSGALDASEAAAARKALGDGHRLSDGILGSEAFVARMQREAARRAAGPVRRGGGRRAGSNGRPSMRELIDAVLGWLEVDPSELEARPRSRRSAQVKRLAIWLWVHEYRGQQSDAARALA